MNTLSVIKGGKNQPKYDRPEKNSVRDLMFYNLGPKTSILTLPSDGALCSEALLRHGVITKDTPQQWVEMSGAISSKLLALAEKHGYSDVTITKQRLETYIPIQQIDFLNADMESTFTENLGMAFENNFADLFLPDTSIVLWLTEWARNPATADFHKWFEAKVRKPGLLRDSVDYVTRNVGHAERSIVLPITMMMCALNKFTFQFEVSKTYADTSSTMVAIRFDHIYRSDVMPTMPSFSSLVQEFRAYHHREYNMTSHQRDIFKILQKHFAQYGNTLEYIDDRYCIIDGNGGQLGSSDQVEHLYEIHRHYI
jgi:hypothetical protein